MKKQNILTVHFEQKLFELYTAFSIGQQTASGSFFYIIIDTNELFFACGLFFAERRFLIWQNTGIQFFLSKIKAIVIIWYWN